MASREAIRVRDARLIELVKAGLSRKELVARLGTSEATLSLDLRRLQLKPPPRGLSPHHAAILKRIQAGETLAGIAERFGLTYQRVQQIASENGLRRRGEQLTDAQKLRIRKLAAAGRTRHEIAEAIGVSYERVCWFTQKNRIKVRSAPRGPRPKAKSR